MSKVCDNCGCGDPEVISVEIRESLFSANDRTARHNREHFARHGVRAINIMGSPGAGKTALLECTARTGRFSACALSGDLATVNDAERLKAAGIHCEAITTGDACHLDAAMVHAAMHGESFAEAISKSDIVFIENVGNLVCPAAWDLGQAANVVVLSVTEGEDKPLKYPVAFNRVDVVVVTKCDLLPHLPGFSIAALRRAIRDVAPAATVFEVSSQTGAGLGDWHGWLQRARPE